MTNFLLLLILITVLSGFGYTNHLIAHLASLSSLQWAEAILIAMLIIGVPTLVILWLGEQVDEH